MFKILKKKLCFFFENNVIICKVKIFLFLFVIFKRKFILVVVILVSGIVIICLVFDFLEVVRLIKK